MVLRVVTDSSCDLPKAIIEQLNITVVPCNLHFGAETLRDGVDIQPGDFYARLGAAGVHPTTSQPSVGAFLETYRRLATEADEIISIHISSKLSGTCHSALQARREMGPRPRIEVVDSLQVSLGLGLLAQTAARAAGSGGNLDDALAAVRPAIPQIRSYFSIDTLRYLVYGGRASRVQGFFGSLLHVKPILVLQGGEVHPVDRVRSRQRVLERLRQIAASYQEVKAFGFSHSACADEAQALARDCAAWFPGAETLLAEFTPVLGVHLGPRALGLTIWGRGPDSS